MNKIKDSFSKIKASDEFKDKLEKELQNNPVKLISKTNPRKIYYRSSITAAAIALILLGGTSYKLIMNSFRHSNSSEIEYSQKDDLSEDNSYVMNDNQNIENNNDVTNENNHDASDEKDNISINSNISKSTIGHKTLSDVSEKASAPPTENPTIKSNIDTDTASASSKEVLNSKHEAEAYENRSLVESTSTDSNPKNTLFSARESSIFPNSVYVPKIELPISTEIIKAKMMPLIVYKGSVYLYTPIKINSESVKNLLGQKLGTTKVGINELSTQSDYSMELASNIGITDVYSINGYDENFRIMTNLTTEDGASYPEFFECLNGLTIQKGEDVFGKLNLEGNITNAKFQTFSDGNNGINNFHPINDAKLLNSLVEELNKAKPYLPEDIESSLGDYRNDDGCKELYLDLKDGSKNINITILKGGYACYGYPKVYFQINSKFSQELWDKLQ